MSPLVFDPPISATATVIGSLLRPTWLLKARDDFAANRMGETEFQQIENRAVDEAIALQEEVGLRVVTDGEMRRLSFQSQLPEAVDGFGEFALDAFLWGEWQSEGAGSSSVPRPPTLGVVDKLKRKRYLCAEEFTYLRDHTQVTPKLSLPSPSLWANFWSPEKSGHVYPTLDSFLADVADILRDEVTELVRLGATCIQLDAPHYPLLIDPGTRAFYESRGWTLDRWLSAGIELDNAVIGEFVSQATFAAVISRAAGWSRVVTTTSRSASSAKPRPNSSCSSTMMNALVLSNL